MIDFSTFNDFFDHIYVITLSRAISRQGVIRQNLQGLNYEFFFGVDKQEHPISDMIRDGIYDEAKAIKNQRYNKTLTGGQICCAWSHKKVYEDVIKKGYQKVLILEDDVIASDDISSLFSSLLKELPQNWELLYLDYIKNETPNIFKKYWYHIQKKTGALNLSHQTITNLYPKKTGKYIAVAGFHDYTSAYAITASAAVKLLQLQTPIAHVADNLLAYASTIKLINGFISIPKLFSQLSKGLDNPIHSFVDDK